MSEAESSLGEGNADSAVDSQGRALDAFPGHAFAPRRPLVRLSGRRGRALGDRRQDAPERCWRCWATPEGKGENPPRTRGRGGTAALSGEKVPPAPVRRWSVIHRPRRFRAGAGKPAARYRAHFVSSCHRSPIGERWHRLCSLCERQSEVRYLPA
jgi:hypothetical protein